ncbi:MAG: N-acetylmuramoyl-L-alanine amidase [Paludibacter sp.]|jgi:N-acetyl-anhydromuramyl-L-alanine amidase AmpD|nr:N-acetylmuramoyl-L-alanine amidase [Paludibacter sp.]MEA5062648.1 N-acetylmuramoyl-L-alanine amidase [Petrimonas sp.]
MRAIEKIIIHCSATPEGRHVSVADITAWHKKRGFRTIGYHFVIYLDGSIHKGRDISEIGAHVEGKNSNSIGICYIGGLDSNGKPKDTRTYGQKSAIMKLVSQLKERFPNSEVLGHRDYSPDKNGNGIIEEWEWLKACPCFDVKKEF